MRRAIATALAVTALAGCGRTETFPGVADVKAALDAGLHCDRDGGVPQLATAQAPDGTPLSWGRLDACVNVSYDIELAPLLPDLRRALADWSFPGCTWMCFTAPTAGGARPVDPADRRIHLARLEGADAPAGTTATTQLNFTPDGEIFSADILLRDELNRPGDAPLLWLVGQVLGFEPTPSVDSALNDRTGVPNALTAADEESVCALYPSCR